MEQLYRQLKQIDELLDQIGAITTNQSTVLLQQTSMDDEAMHMLETMVDYKEELINELQKIEEQFNHNYTRNKEKLKEKSDILKFKECVSRILEKKQQIQETEKNNVVIMQSKQSQRIEKTEILRNPKDVVAAYKKQQKEK